MSCEHPGQDLALGVLARKAAAPATTAVEALLKAQEAFQDAAQKRRDERSKVAKAKMAADEKAAESGTSLALSSILILLQY